MSIIKRFLQRGWKALRIASYLPFILFPDFKRRKSSLHCRRQLASRGKWSPAFLVGHSGALGDLDFADLSFLLGTAFGVQDSVLLVPLCRGGGEIQVSDGALAIAMHLSGWTELGPLAWFSVRLIILKLSEMKSNYVFNLYSRGKANLKN